MGFLDGFFVEKKYDKPIADGKTVSRAIAGSSSTSSIWGNYTATTKWDVNRAVNQAYSKVVWVFRAVHAIAAAQASLEIVLKDISTIQGRVKDDPDFWRLLNRRANPFEDAWTFRYRLSSQSLLSPKGAFIEVVEKGGSPAELYLLDPEKVTPIPDPRRWIKSFRVERGDGQVDDLNPDKIVWVRTSPHPIDPYRNVTPLESAGISVETDIFARLFNRNYLRKDGRPGLLIAADGDLDPEVADELQYILNNSQGETRVIEADGLTSVELGTKPRDAQWSEALDSAKDSILTAFGVPESVLGNASGRCLRASEFLHLSNGSTKRAEELIGQTFKLWQPTRDGLREVEAKAEYAQKETVYRIKTFSGRTLETNSEHPLFMAESVGQGQKGVWKKHLNVSGWTPMSQIKSHWDQNDRIKAGSYTEVAVPTIFNQVDSDNRNVVRAKQDAALLTNIPDYIFTATDDTQKAFVSELYSLYGKVSQHTGFDIYLPTQEYATKLQRLLLRLGVYGNVTIKKQQHAVEILTKPNILTFLYQTELTGKAKENADKVQARLTTNNDFTIHSLRNDKLPTGMMWDRVLEVEEIGKDQTVAITIQNSDERHYLSMFWEHNTYSNADSEGETFWTTTMKTHCDAIARAMEPLTGNDQDNVYLEYDYSKVDVLQRADRRRLDRYRQDLNTGAITINDYRQRLGLDPLSGEQAPYGRVFWNPKGLVAGSAKDIDYIKNQYVVGQQDQISTNPFAVASAGGGDGIVGGQNDQVQGELAQSDSDTAQTTNDQAARTLRSADGSNTPTESVNPGASSEIHDRVNDLINKRVTRETEVKTIQGDPNRDLRNRMQGFIEGSIESWSNRQLNVVGDRLSHTKVRKGTRHWEGESGTKALDVNYLLDTKNWTEDITGTVQNVLRGMLTKEAQIRVNDLKDSGVKIDHLNADDITRVLDSVSELFVKGVSQQSNLVQRHIGVLDSDGKSIDEIKSTLKPENFDRYHWSVLIAKRLTTNSIEQLNDLISNRIEGKVLKTWKTALNELERDNHAELNNKTIPFGEDFEVGSVRMPYPTAILNDEADSCSCWINYEVIK